MLLSTTSQVLALTRRYVITLLRSPFATLLRIFVWPGLLIGLSFYILSKSGESELVNNVKFELFLPTIIWIGVSFHLYHFVNWLAMDKESGMKSLMISMGLKRVSYYIANSLLALITVGPIIIFAAVSMTIYMFQDTLTSWVGIYLVLTLFVLHLIGWIWVFASMIPSTRLSSLVFILIFMEPLVHVLVVYVSYKSSKTWASVTMFLGSIDPFESIRILSSGYILCKNCDTVEADPSGQVNQPMSMLLMAMAVWTIAAFAFARWFEEVCPWQSDSAVKSPLFCITSLFRFKGGMNTHLIEGYQRDLRRDPRFFEESNRHGEVGIQISRLSKSFKGISAVNNVTFNIHRGETTLLLGHNGAGKTTLMNMILDKLTPDSGKVKINPALDQASTGRLGVGICPQTSVLDNNLSVKQHLDLFLDIKSSAMASGQHRDQHIMTTIRDVSLNGHEHKKPEELSGGMKRKLSLAMAFIGESNILILDEPSSGLDPDSRIFVWNAIRRYRADRTVLLSTQHMEEADYLGDRIAIMNNGQIICAGSSTFLNNTFGSGYKLRVEYHLSMKEQVLKLIREHFKFAKETEGASLNMPAETKQTDPVVDMVVELGGEGNKTTDEESKIISLLESIESKSETMGIKSYSLRSSSIEDVLMNTCNLTYGSDGVHNHTKVNMTNTKELLTRIHSLSSGARDGSHLASTFKHLQATVSKLIHSYFEDWISILIYRVILPPAILWTIISQNLDNPYVSLRYYPEYRFALMIMFFISYPTKERVSKFKIMQLTSNSNFISYWAGMLLADFAWTVLMAVELNVLMQLVFDGTYIEGATLVLSLMTLAVIMFGIVGAIHAYVMSLVYSNSGNAVGYQLVLYSLSPLCNMLSLLLSLIIVRKDVWWSNITDYFFLAIFPTDAISYIFYGLGTQCYLGQKAPSLCEPKSVSPLLLGFIALSAQMVVYTALLYVAERKNLDLQPYLNIWRIFSRGPRNHFPAREGEIDEDVVSETTKAMTLIKSASPQTHSLVVADVNKSYVKNVKVVEHLSLTVRRGECFGLLGVNGAGKSTTFSMIVAESRPDSGRIWLNGHYNTDDVTAYRRKLGYDPQSNPEMSLTPYQALELMAKLRSVPDANIPMLVNSVLDILNMSEHTYKSAQSLSGGTKRKLALGMALIGNPSILALDEPTAGVDPIARRGIWELLRSLRSQCGMSIIISSHAMEECEAICNRISIMACGRLRCIGTFLHLRSKFAQGCSIRVNFSLHANPQSSHASQRESVSKETTSLIVSELKARIESEVGAHSVRLADSNINSATLNITDNRVRRSILFKIVREFRQKHPNMSYLFNDSSLEDIFISLAREQQELAQQGLQQASSGVLS